MSKLKLAALSLACACAAAAAAFAVATAQAGSSKQSLLLTLTNPRTGFASTSGSTFMIAGRVADDSGRVASVALSDWPQGQSLTPRHSGLFRFRFQVQLHYGANEYHLVAKDSAGNESVIHLLIYWPRPHDDSGPSGP